MQMCSRPFAAVKLTPFAGRVSELGESLARPTPDSEKYDTMTPSSLLHQNQQTDRQTKALREGTLCLEHRGNFCCLPEVLSMEADCWPPLEDWGWVKCLSSALEDGAQSRGVRCSAWVWESRTFGQQEKLPRGVRPDKTLVLPVSSVLF